MNILISPLPETVNISGKSYPINADFRAGVEFEMMIERGEESAFNLVAPFFPDGLPFDISGALRAVELFYCCGELPEKSKKAEKPTQGKQAYSFGVDASAIFADFWRYYRIDLTREWLHWWAFRALLMGLPEKSEFKQRVYYRTCDLKDLSKRERARVMGIRSKIEIENKTGGKLTLEERNAAMKAYIAQRSAETAGGGLNG